MVQLSFTEEEYVGVEGVQIEPGVWIGIPRTAEWEPGLPILPDWYEVSTSSTTTTPTASTSVSGSSLSIQQDIGKQIRSIAAKLRYCGPIFGNTRVGARIAILREKSDYVYMLGILGLGEIDEITQLEVGGRTLTTGDIESDPSYLGDWSSSGTWTALGGLPYACQVGDIFKYVGKYYTCRSAFSVTAYAYPYTPATGGYYASYFDSPLVGATANTYLGTSTQTADSLMVELIGAGWTDPLRGQTPDGEDYSLAYFTIKIPLSTNNINFLEASAVVKGGLYYDPRTATTIYSSNPAVCLAALITSPLWGLGASIDWDSVESAADYCDDAFTDGERIQLNMALISDRPEEVSMWIEVLRAYAMCFILFEGGKYYLIPDTTRTSSGTVAFPPDDGALPMLGPPQVSMLLSAANEVLVRWTDTNGWVSFSTDSCTAGVEAGTSIPFQSELRLPGITSEEEAQRYADYRLNKAQLERVQVSFAMPDCGLLVSPGERWTLKSPNLGASGLDVIIQTITERGIGDFQITALEYDANVYEEPPA